MIKKFFTILSAVILAALLCSCNVSKTEETVRTLTVSGTGTSTLSTQQVSLKFYFKSSEWNVNYAIEKNTNNVNKAIEALKALGIAESDMRTIDFSISQDNSNTYPGKYTVLNHLMVLVRDTSTVGNIIDTAIVNGALGLTDYNYQLAEDKTTALRQARTMAVQKAQDAAALLAGASGCKVDSVLDIKESAPYITTNSIFADPSMENMGITSLSEEGSVSINATVTITYSITE